MHIVSASRRTDIPAFYTDWLLARVRVGWAASVNPFNRRARRVSLRAEDVRALVLWSKDFTRFDDAAAWLADVGHRLYFQYTVTGLPAALEPRVPTAERAIDAAHRLARRFGAGAVQWRYDPILLGDAISAEDHVRRFADLAARFEGATTRCIVSFGTYYRKVVRTLRGTGWMAGEGAPLSPPDDETVRALAETLAGEAERRGMTMMACCTPAALREPDLFDGASAGGRVVQAACIDADHIERLYPGAGAGVPKLRSRPGCGCSASRDIGLYDCCPHGCLYCYANENADVRRLAARRGRAAADGPVPWGRLEATDDGDLRWITP